MLRNFFWILIICSCSRPKQSVLVPVIKIDNHYVDTLKLSDILQIDTAGMVYAPESEILGEVKSVMPFHGGYLVHSGNPQAISVVNSNFRIEWQCRPDFRMKSITEVSQVNDAVYVLDRDGMSVHILNRYLQWQNSFRIPVFAQSFGFLDSTRIALYTGNEITEYNKGKVVVYQAADRRVLHDWLPVNEKQRRYFNFLTNYHFPRTGNELFFWDSSIDQLFLVTKEGLRSSLRLDYGSWSLPPDFYNNANFENAFDFVQHMRQQPYAFRHFKIRMNENYVWIHFEKSGNFLQTIYNQKTDKSVTFSVLYDDLLLGRSLEDIRLTFNAGLAGTNTFIGYVPAEMLTKEGGFLKKTEQKAAPCGMLIFGRMIY